MRLLCNGVALDLAEGTKLELKKTNPLFAIDKIERERTLQFDLPKTATNMRAFSLAHDAHNSGEGMRVRYKAEMQQGAVVRGGWLYVNEYSDSHFSCVMVLTDSSGLDVLKEAGNLRDIFDASDLAAYYVTMDGSLSASTDDVFALSYVLLTDDNAGGAAGWPRAKRPTITYVRLLNLVAAKLGLQFTPLVPSGTKDAQIVVLKPKNTLGNDAEGSDSVRMYDNLPDITTLDLFRSYAAISGTVLTETSGRVEFVSASIPTGQPFDLSARVLGVSSVSRTFADYSQNNYVQDDGKWRVRTRDEYTPRVRTNYSIRNENLQSDSVLYEIPFDAGHGFEIYMPSNPTTWLAMNRGCAVWDNSNMSDFGIATKWNEGEEVQNPNDRFNVYPIDGEHKLENDIDWYRVLLTFKASALTERVCEVSTMADVSVRMSAADFLALDASRLILINGLLAMWYSATWSNGVAKLTLAKI